MNELIAAIIAYLTSESTTDRFTASISALIGPLVSSELDAAKALLGVDFQLNADDIAAQWISNTRNRVRGIDAVTAEELAAVISEGIAAGDTITEIANRILDVFDFADRARAVTIARTEVIGASNFAALSSFIAGGVPYKRWLATMDDRTRETHASANEQVAEVQLPFYVGGARLMYPGDPEGPAKEVINCRCTIIPEHEQERSVWTVTTSQRFYRSYSSRMNQWEKRLQEIIRHEFRIQYAAVTYLLGRANGRK